MLLSDRDLKAALASGRMALTPYDEALVQPSSIDVRLDRFFRVFANHRHTHIDPAQQQDDLTELVEVADDRVTARRLFPESGSGEAHGAQMSWREIEVELVSGDRDLVDRVDVRLRAGGLRRAKTASKLAHVLGTGASAAGPR